MTALGFDDPCVLFALRRESAPFLREFRPQQSFPGSPCFARFCGPAWLSVLVVETGVGDTATERALDWLFSGPILDNVAYRPKVVVSAGFAGGLHPERSVGDLVLATEVVDPTGVSWPTTWPGDLPPGEWRPPLHRGRLLTVSRLLAASGDKLAHGQRYQALAVDMESSTVARRCREEGVPFGCLRAISDDAQTTLSPRLVQLLSGGRVSPVRLASALALQPGLAVHLWRLARQTHFASAQLGTALGELLTLTLPWGREL